MAKESLAPEYVLGQLKKGRLFPFYLFYGPDRFSLEKSIKDLREDFIPEGARDFNLQVFYGGKPGLPETSHPADIIDAARSLPFMCQNRLIIVRMTQDYPAASLESLIPYLENPVDSTCLIFVSSNPDFRIKFYRKIKESGRAVNFKKLYDNQIIPWIRKMATDMGFHIEEEACDYLKQIAGDSLMELFSEIEKLYIRYGQKTIGIKEVKELAINSRTFTIFELLDKISLKRSSDAIEVLNRFLEEEGDKVSGSLMGMLNRQIRLLWGTLSILNEGGRQIDLNKKLKLQPFQTQKLIKQSKKWRPDELERALNLLYKTDGLIKSGANRLLVLENLILSICLYKSPAR
ncbi:MAG: DNA polymerase III subunit delta [Desulfobacteraceae bacterium 4484_190.1]|nr:MAG: DNA polymerase III subunit delta [Desulfobacteraceae bacterium 4484_190.1]